jgi:MoaA/NifB/PqqE/SkfB family radical SAM enzyme
MPETFCPLPWISLSLRNNGQYRLCCPAGQAEDKGLLRASDGRELLADRDSFASARNSELARAARVKMLNGEWPSTCKRCIEEESAGVKSRRVVEKEIWKNTITLERARALTAADGSIGDLPVAHMDLRFGNRCNLKCRSCNPTESSKWLGDHYEMWGPEYKESTYKVTIQKQDGQYSVSPNPYDWHDSEKFWQEIESRMDGVKLVYFAGGEPLLIERHFEFLEKCIQSGRAKEMVLEYNTNLTLLPERALRLWREFERVQFGVSIDGVGAVNDYIRHPSKWENVERNLHILDSAPGNFVIWIASTVMAYNVLHLPELLVWKIRSRFARVNNNADFPLICPHPLHGPPFLNIQMFRPEEKARIASRLREDFERVFNEIESAYAGDMKIAAHRQAREIRDGYIAFMNAKDLSQYREKFDFYTKSLDRLRNQTLSEGAPELGAIL